MQRNFDNFNQQSHDFNVNRRLNERDGMFMQSKYQPNSTHNYRLAQFDFENEPEIQDEAVGEITGEIIGRDQLEAGMPLRPKARVTTDRYRMIDEEEQRQQQVMTNPKLDFDLFHEKPSSKFSYYDPLNENITKQNIMEFSDFGKDERILPDTFSKSPSDLFSQINNQFTFAFLNKFLRNMKQPKELILSPYSILQVFVLLYLGSKNQTERDLQNYFSFPDKQSLYNSVCNINSHLNQSGVFSKMNLVLIPNHLNVNSAYVEYINRLGHLKKYSKQNAMMETQKYNHMIANMTNGLIQNLLEPGMFQGINAVLLINVIYFYSKWKYSFDRRSTRPEIFNGITRKQVPMMNLSDKKFRYFEDHMNQVLEMDYRDNVFTMGIILPKGSQMPTLNFQQYIHYVNNLREQKISTLKLPRFRHESRYDIKRLFEKDGLKDTLNKTDIGDIVTSKLGYYVDQIIHNAVIMVNEEGTEAAAATLMCVNSFSSSSNKPINFIANHPFLYYIRHKPTNMVIFVGQYF